MTKKYHYIYKITNKINGMFYIGKHSTNDLEDGYMGSSSYLNEAIQKEGIENFSKEIIQILDTEEEAYNAEKNAVDEFLISDNMCYNKSLGGRGITSDLWQTSEFRDKIHEYYNNPKLKEKHIAPLVPYFTSKEHQSKAAKQIYVKHPEHREFLRLGRLVYNTSEAGRNESRNRAEHMRSLLQQKSPEEKQLVKLKQGLGSLNRFPYKNLEKIQLKLLQIKDLEDKINANKK